MSTVGFMVTVRLTVALRMMIDNGLNITTGLMTAIGLKIRNWGRLRLTSISYLIIIIYYTGLGKKFISVFHTTVRLNELIVIEKA